MIHNLGCAFAYGLNNLIRLITVKFQTDEMIARLKTVKDRVLIRQTAVIAVNPDLCPHRLGLNLKSLSDGGIDSGHQKKKENQG